MYKPFSIQKTNTSHSSASSDVVGTSTGIQIDNRVSTLQLRQLHASISASPRQSIQKQRVSETIQRQPVRVRNGEDKYSADYDSGTELLKIVINGKNLFINYTRNNVKYDKKSNEFIIDKHISPFIDSWKNNNLVLYRGVNVTHAVYDSARQGSTPAKPGATSEIPEFTSDNSTTKFIPYSTSRNIAVMAAKTNPREDAEHNLGQEAANADEIVGVYVRNVVGTSHSICIFSEGEIQILDPPTGRAVEVRGRSLLFGNRLDRGELDEDAVVFHLRERLQDEVWALLGKGLFGCKEPDGIKEMKAVLKAGKWQEALRIAQDKHLHRAEAKRRHPAVAELYESLTAIADKLLPLQN